MSGAVTQVTLSAAGTLALVITSFFLRFYRDTRDRFFILFALGFFALAADWLLISIFAPSPSPSPSPSVQHLFYVPRLAAFAFFAAAIIDKNQRGR